MTELLLCLPHPTAKFDIFHVERFILAALDLPNRSFELIVFACFPSRTSALQIEHLSWSGK